MVIVAAVDRSDRAETVVGEAKALADSFGDTVHVVHVVSKSRFVELERSEVQKTGRAVDLDAIREYATQIAAQAVEAVDVAAETVGLVGNAVDELLTYVDEHDARYVVVGPRRRSPTGKALFGSTAQSILLESNCPVVVAVESGE